MANYLTQDDVNNYGLNWWTSPNVLQSTLSRLICKI
jgi:hypothetical protein